MLTFDAVLEEVYQAGNFYSTQRVSTLLVQEISNLLHVGRGGRIGVVATWRNAMVVTIHRGGRWRLRGSLWLRLLLLVQEDGMTGVPSRSTFRMDLSEQSWVRDQRKDAGKHAPPGRDPLTVMQPRPPEVVNCVLVRNAMK